MISKGLIAAIDDILRPRGFVRQEILWNRTRAEFIDVFDIQISTSIGKFTMNVGILDTVVHKIFWNSDPPAFIEEPACTIRTRVGELIDGKDRWWEFSDKEAVDQLSEIVSSYVLPFIENVGSREKMEAWLLETRVARRRQPAPIVNLAILKTLLGKHAEGCRLLTELRGKMPVAWRDRIDGVARRVECVANSSDSP